MEIMTIRVPKWMKELFNEMKKIGMIDSVSDFVRYSAIVMLKELFELHPKSKEIPPKYKRLIELYLERDVFGENIPRIHKKMEEGIKSKLELL